MSERCLKDHVMKIALIGYGKMGRSIERIALSRGYSVVARITSTSWDMEAVKAADICIEFTHPESVLENIRKIAEVKKPIIIGTTGWDANVEHVRSIVETHGIGALHAPNFSIGVHLFLEILSHAAKVMNLFEEYEAAGIEYHHSSKQDSPSGTAKAIAKAIEKNMERIDRIPFSSVRCGSIPGTHTILFDSPCDTISLTHTARNRDGWAQGALFAAEWLKDKKGLFTFSDCMRDIVQGRSL